jgi:hypothetical protein
MISVYGEWPKIADFHKLIPFLRSSRRVLSNDIREIIIKPIYRRKMKDEF